MDPNIEKTVAALVEALDGGDDAKSKGLAIALAAGALSDLRRIADAQERIAQAAEGKLRFDSN